MTETPNQAAARIVDDVLRGWQTNYPETATRRWARDHLAARQRRRQEQTVEAFEQMGAAAGEAWNVLGGFASAYLNGFREAMESDPNEGRRILEDAGIDPEEVLP